MTDDHRFCEIERRLDVLESLRGADAEALNLRTGEINRRLDSTEQTTTRLRTFCDTLSGRMLMFSGVSALLAAVIATIITKWVMS